MPLDVDVNGVPGVLRKPQRHIGGQIDRPVAAFHMVDKLMQFKNIAGDQRDPRIFFQGPQ